MKVCVACNNYAFKCKCRKNKDIRQIDDDIAPLIIEYNRVFKKLGFTKIRTKFCCAGHIRMESENRADLTYVPQSYIMFATDNEQFDLPEFFADIKELKLPKGISLDFAPHGGESFIVGVGLRKPCCNISLQEMANFLKAKAMFFDYLVCKLKELKIY